MKQKVLDNRVLTMNGNFRQLVSACIGKAYLNQLAMGQLVQKGQDWFIDLEKGIIRFGGEVFPMQLLGSESYYSNTWLWGWANPAI